MNWKTSSSLNWKILYKQQKQYKNCLDHNQHKTGKKQEKKQEKNVWTITSIKQEKNRKKNRKKQEKNRKKTGKKHFFFLFLVISLISGLSII